MLITPFSFQRKLPWKSRVRFIPSPLLGKKELNTNKKKKQVRSSMYVQFEEVSKISPKYKGHFAT